MGVGDNYPRPRYLDAACPRCGARLAPEHAHDDACRRWVCSELCCETVHVDSSLMPRSYTRKRRREEDSGEYAGLTIVDEADGDDD